ncbi:MAG: hypothetical protein ACR2PG_23775 [Hyphomicrobiaceae bacterium]
MTDLSECNHNQSNAKKSVAGIWPPAGSFAFALLAFATVWLVFSWPWLSGRMTIPWDAKAHFAPQVQFMAASLGRGELPFWNPFVFSGHPQLSDPQSMIFSPSMFLLALVNPRPSLWAIDAAALAMLLFAGLGVLLLARDLGWHWAAGLLAAIAFAFGAAMAWRLQHFGQIFSMAFFPMALFLLRRAFERRSILSGGAAGLLTALIVLGRDQVALLCIYLLVGYCLWQWLVGGQIARRIEKSLPPFCACVCVCAMLVAIPILMTAQLAADSNRPSIDFEGAGRGSLHPALLVTAVVPHLFGAAGDMADYWGPPSYAWADTGLYIAQNMGIVYIGAVPFLLLVLGLARGYFMAPEIRFFFIAFVIVLLYGLGWYTPFFRLAFELLPGVDYYRRPADAVFLIGGLAAMLTGYSAHRFLTDCPRAYGAATSACVAACVVAIFGLGLAFAVLFDRLLPALSSLSGAATAFVIAAVALVAALWLRPVRPVLAGAILVLPSAIDLIVNNGPNGASALPTKSLEMLDTDNPVPTIRTLQTLVSKRSNHEHRPRVELVGLGFHWPNASMSHRLENTLGYNPVRWRLYSEAIGAGDTVGLPTQRIFSKLFPSYRSRLAAMLGLRYIASGVPLEDIDRALVANPLSFVARTEAAYIYENADVLPRVMFVSHARRADFAEILRTGNWPDFDPRTSVLLEDGVGNHEPGTGGSARLTSYKNTEVVVSVKSANGGWVILNDLWHPAWRVSVNGRDAKISRANVLFRAVRVEAGDATLRYVFSPVAHALSTMWTPTMRREH